jgi:hypothetical protein
MNTVNDKIQDLISQIGPVFPDIDAVIQTEDPSWAIQFVDELVVMIEQLENPDRMVFSSEIGAVTDDQELPVYEALLCYNLLWKDTGGVKIGLAGPKGILIVTTELLLDGLTLMSFQEALTNFTNISRSLGKYVVRDKKNPSSLPNVNPHSLHLQA